MPPQPPFLLLSDGHCCCFFSSFLLILMPTTFLLLASTIIDNASSVSVYGNEQNCDGNCIQEMERQLIEATPTAAAGISVNPFLYSAERNFMSQFFARICDAYRGVDECMVRCEKRNKQVADLKAAYSGLQFVCKERKDEFFSSLPCLSENESKGMRKCSAQINQSQETTVLFTNSIISREFHSMQLRFSSLCRDLSSVIRCMIPVIRDNCGERPSNLLLKFIGLEFSSFELLYRQLGFDSSLPTSCRSLIKFALANNNDHHVQKARKPSKFYHLKDQNEVYNMALRKETLLLIPQIIALLISILALSFSFMAWI